MLKEGIKLTFFVLFFISSSFSTEIITKQTAKKTLTINEDLTITNSGSFDLIGTGNLTAVDTLGNYNGTIINDGTVLVTSDDDAYAFNIHGDFNGSFTNNSSITSIGNTTSNSSYTYIFNTSNNFLGNFTNNGTTSSKSSSSDNFTYAYGIDTRNMNNSVFTNNGIINVSSTSASRYARVYALDLDDVINNSIINSTGSISAVSNAFEYVSAHAVDIDNFDSTSTINLNDINVEAISSTLHADSYGVYFKESMEGNLTLSGQMNISSKGRNESEAYGVYRSDDNPNPGHFDGNILHSGTSTVFASSSAENAIATFFYIVNGNLNGTFSNNSTINVSSTAIDNSSRARGLYIDGEVNNSISNLGTISAISNNTNENSEAFAIQVIDNTNANLINSGKIISQGTSVNGSVQVRGIYLNDINNSSITNNGFVSSSAKSSSRYAQAYGVSTSALSNSTLNSSGSILASATSSDSYTRAYGIQLYSSSGSSLDATSSLIVNDVTAIANGDNNSRSESNGLKLFNTVAGTVTLNGTINSIASGNASSDAYGVNIATLDGTLTNNGNINTSISYLGDTIAVKITDGTGVFTNSASAVLNGSINVGGNVVVNNSGTWNLKNNDSATIANNYNQNSGSNINFILKNPMTYPQLDVTGIASLDANSKINIITDKSSSLKIGDSFIDIISAGTLNNSIVNASDSSILLDYDLVQDANTLDLTIKQGVSVRDILKNSNKEFANYWDNLIKDGTNRSDLNSILSSLYLMSNKKEVAETLENNLPYGNLSTMNTLEKLNSSINSIVSTRQTQKDLLNGDEVKNKNLWLKPFYSKVSQDNNEAYGYEADTYGLVLGFDKSLNLDNHLGLALLYANSDIDVNNLNSNTKVDSYLARLYGSSIVFDNKTFLDWQVGLGFHKNESLTKHVINNSRAKADYNSISSQLSAKLSKPFSFAKNSLFTPFVKASYMYQKNASYKQSGAGVLNMKVDSSNSDKLLLGLGSLYNYEINPFWSMATKLALNYNLLNNVDSITSSYVTNNSVSFTTKGIKEQAFSYEFGLSSKYEQSENLNINFIYDLEGSSDFTNNSLSVKLNWLF